MYDRIPGGLADGKTPKDFPRKALLKGIKVEMEHTSDAKVAIEIAMDHLTEDVRYYDKLQQIEKKAGTLTPSSFATSPDLVYAVYGEALEKQAAFKDWTGPLARFFKGTAAQPGVVAARKAGIGSRVLDAKKPWASSPDTLVQWKGKPVLVGPPTRDFGPRGVVNKGV